jgi:hypothetical protein
MAGEEAAAALFLALAVGGGAIAASHVVQDRQIKKAMNQSQYQSVMRHKLVDHQGTNHQHTENLATERNIAKLRQEMSAASQVVPAYKVRRGLRTVLPARIENNHESNYFYDRLKKGANRTNWPNYDHPKYLMYAAESEEGRTLVTMEDLARALEALNGKVEEYRNAIYHDIKEIHSSPGGRNHPSGDEMLDHYHYYVEGMDQEVFGPLSVDEANSQGQFRSPWVYAKYIDPSFGQGA